VTFAAIFLHHTLTPDACLHFCRFGDGQGRVFGRGCTMSELWYDATLQLGYRMILVGDFHYFGIKISFGTTFYLGYGEESQGWRQDCLMQLETDIQIPIHCYIIRRITMERTDSENDLL
jgi:hypothetical protein